MQSLKYGYMIEKKNGTLSRLFHCLKTHLLALLGLLPTEITDFSTLSNTWLKKKKKNRTLSRLFHCLKTHLLALLGLLPTEITDFSTLFGPLIEWLFPWFTRWFTVSLVSKSQVISLLWWKSTRLVYCLKTHLLALLGLLPTEITDFSTLLNTSTSVISTLSYTEAGRSLPV